MTSQIVDDASGGRKFNPHLSYAAAIALGVLFRGEGRSALEAHDLAERWNEGACEPPLDALALQEAVYVAYFKPELADRIADAPADAEPAEQASRGAELDARLPSLDDANAPVNIGPSSAANDAPAVASPEPVLPHSGAEAATASPLNRDTAEHPQSPVGPVACDAPVEAEPRAEVVATNYLVLSINPRSGGRETFSRLCLTETFPKTTRMKTDDDCDHIIYALYKGERVKSGKNALGAGIAVNQAAGTPD